VRFFGLGISTSCPAGGAREVECRAPHDLHHFADAACERCPLPLAGVTQDAHSEVLATEMREPYPRVVFWFSPQSRLLSHEGQVLPMDAHEEPGGQFLLSEEFLELLPRTFHGRVHVLLLAPVGRLASVTARCSSIGPPVGVCEMAVVVLDELKE
jgi:hypothetical protein